jgi:DNA-directed RNA polymerase specialized sigma subunit
MVAARGPGALVLGRQVPRDEALPEFGVGQLEELVLRHIGFVIFRIRKKAFPAYVRRFGEDLLSQAVFILYDKIKSYDLKYRDKQGNPKPVRFSSYIWKRIDGFIIDSLKKELEREKRQENPDWERFDQDGQDTPQPSLEDATIASL